MKALKIYLKLEKATTLLEKPRKNIPTTFHELRVEIKN
jgi:hypothetical protein